MCLQSDVTIGIPRTPIVADPAERVDRNTEMVEHRNGGIEIPVSVSIDVEIDLIPFRGIKNSMQFLIRIRSTNFILTSYFVVLLRGHQFEKLFTINYMYS